MGSITSTTQPEAGRVAVKAILILWAFFIVNTKRWEKIFFFLGRQVPVIMAQHGPQQIISATRLNPATLMEDILIFIPELISGFRKDSFWSFPYPVYFMPRIQVPNQPVRT